jgi:hypothetical protein
MDMPDATPLVYLVLGAAGSGRREVLADLITDGLVEGDRAAVLLSSDEPPSPFDEKLPGLVRWTWDPEIGIEAEMPEGATHVFVVTDGRRNPIDQIQSFQAWLMIQGGELARVLCVVHCGLAVKHHPLLVWYDALIHFSDVVLLNRRDGVENKWIGDFQARYKGQFFPCLFELVKAGRVKNPALVLAPGALRLSQAFDELVEGLEIEVEYEIGGDPETEEEEEQAAEEVEEEELKEDVYFARLAGGRRAKEIPDINKYLE